jgi:hypothetical protein
VLVVAETAKCLVLEVDQPVFIADAPIEHPTPRRPDHTSAEPSSETVVVEVRVVGGLRGA